MSKLPPDWGVIRAAFEAGATIAALAKDYGVSIAEILRRAKAEKWSRKPPPDPAAVVALPVVIAKPTRAERVEMLVNEAASDIIRQHRERTRTLRDTYDTLVAEFQAMMRNLVSFLDDEQMRKIVDATAGERTKLLVDMLKAMNLKFSSFERVMNMLAVLVELERKVWGLNDQDSDEPIAPWDDLLELVRKPVSARPLPDNVVRFDRMMQSSAPEK